MVSTCKSFRKNTPINPLYLEGKLNFSPKKEGLREVFFRAFTITDTIPWNRFIFYFLITLTMILLHVRQNQQYLYSLEPQ